MVPSSSTTIAAVAVTAASLTYLVASSSFIKKKRRGTRVHDDDHDDDRSAPLSSSKEEVNPAISKGGYESLIGNTPLLHLPHISSLLPNRVKIYVKMESMNPGGTGKDRAARSMILDAERRGELPPPLRRSAICSGNGSTHHHSSVGEKNKSRDGNQSTNKNGNHHQQQSSPTSPPSSFSNIPSNIHSAILTALYTTQTHGILIEGTSGSTGISLASLSCSRGHAVIVVMPDDQSQQKVDFLKRLGCGVVVVQNCSISNPGHYVNVAKRVWEWLEVERRYDGYYAENVVGGEKSGVGNDNNGQGTSSTSSSSSQRPTPPKLIQAAFMNQFENLANVQSHYLTTGPEIHSQLNGNVDAFVMSAGTGGTLVGTGGYLKEKWWRDHRDNNEHDNKATATSSLSSTPPRIVLVDPPGSSLFNKVKYGVAYASQQSERKLRRHRYDTLAEGIGLDRITANFGLGCDGIVWSNNNSDVTNGGGKGSFGNRIAKLINNETADKTQPNNDQRQSASSNSQSSKIIDDAISVTDQQAVHMAHFLLRHEGLFVGSSTAMNVVGALVAASEMPQGSNVVTVVCDGGQRHTGRFWNRDFVVDEWGLIWPGDDDVDVVGDDGEKAKRNFLKLLGIDFESMQ
eukprot:CAMPEP_0201681936 /NCGR_PEP_ID=MMETSP0494-20130426/51365_1 /ASSEMBLY_ACC=CAM_ASM_000839 /TAXON_ID=420259 /ORGANISM="Thalassiosira gravida, Strain GMp14c1" /LENGTH=627 /DNA_ID=CAMNT_0048165689 /DNA_START=146 /DNA_END=2029 /DNA_ORIENTATION=-